MTFGGGFCMAPVPWKRPYSDNCSGGSHSVGEGAQLMMVRSRRRGTLHFFRKKQNNIVTDMVDAAFW